MSHEVVWIRVDDVALYAQTTGNAFVSYRSRDVSDWKTRLGLLGCRGLRFLWEVRPVLPGFGDISG